MDNNGLIELRNLKFHAYHGCLKKERVEGGEYNVTLKCWLDLSDAASSDCLDDTVDYSKLYDIVKDEMRIPSDLIEHVAGNILKRVRSFAPQIKSASVTVCKLMPPFDYTADAIELKDTEACVTLSY